MGWKQRDWHVGRYGAFGDMVFDRNGNAGNSIWANGAVIGTWAHRKDASVALEYFENVTKTVRSMVDTSIDRYRATVGATVVRPRYPAPRQASLLAGARTSHPTSAASASQIRRFRTQNDQKHRMWDGERGHVGCRARRRRAGAMVRWCDGALVCP